jgi:hypothetical protein
MSPSAENRTLAGRADAVGLGDDVVAGVADGAPDGADVAAAGGEVEADGDVTASGLLQATKASGTATVASTVTAVRRRVMTAV